MVCLLCFVSWFVCLFLFVCWLIGWLFGLLLTRMTCLKTELVITFNLELPPTISLIFLYFSVPQCDPPKIPDSAIVYYPRRMKKKFKYSDRVLLKCKDGYFKSRGGILSCQGSKQWTGVISCSRKFSF